MKPYRVGDRVTVIDTGSGDVRVGWEGIVHCDPNPLRSGKWSSLDVDFGDKGILRVYLHKLTAGGKSEFIQEDWS